MGVMHVVRDRGWKWLVCRTCILLGLTASLWLDTGCGLILARSDIALASRLEPGVPPVAPRPEPGVPQDSSGDGKQEAQLAQYRGPDFERAARPAIGSSLSLSLLTASSDTSRTEAKPFYKRTWFLVGVASLVAATAVALASSGGDEDRPGESTGLPGFPPPPGRH